MHQGKEETSLAIGLIQSMSFARSREFAQLINKFGEDESARKATIRNLTELVGSGVGENREKAIELLGCLRIQEAEAVLSQLLESKFPETVLAMLSRNPKTTTAEHLLLAKLLTSLMMINPAKWLSVAVSTGNRFHGSWIEASLARVAEHIRTTC